MLNTAATTMTPAADGHEVIVLETAGELSRWPVIGWGIVPHYGLGARGSILPIALGIVFNGDDHTIAMPDGRVLTTAGGRPRWYRDGKSWASAVSEAMAERAWHEAAVAACRRPGRLEMLFRRG